MKRFLPLLRLLALACPLLLSQGAAHAQSSPPKENLSDAERAKRDAEKVFGFLKFSTVKPAPPPGAKSAPAAPVRSAAPAPVAANKATAAPPATLTAEATPAPQQVAAQAAVPAAVPAVPPDPAPGATTPQSEALATAAAQAEPEPEEVPLKLTAYVAPELDNKLLDLIGDRRIQVPVRFKVEADGHVSAAQVQGAVPRALGQAAVRAVQRWRFAPLPAGREVDVEIAFQVGS